MDYLYVFSFVNFLHGDWSWHTSPLQQARWQQQLASCNMGVKYMVATVWLQESQNHGIAKVGKDLNEHRVQNEGHKGTSKLMTLSDCNTDLALASNHFWPLWRLQSFRTVLVVFWRLLLRPAWTSARLHFVQSRKGSSGTAATHGEHLTQTHIGTKAGGHFLGGEWCSSSATLQTIFVCDELFRHCQLEKEIRR